MMNRTAGLALIFFGSMLTSGAESVRRDDDAAATSTTSTAAARHWAFQPIHKSELPADPTGSADHPIDRFITAKQREQGVAPVGPADKRTLIRRVTFDLIGLPPSPEEIAAFLADDSADSFSRLVDRLLASPRYGERWGRHWMDVVRYADTAGDNADYPVPEAQLYRDYIIDAFNADKPFDQFVREQLAGDLLARRLVEDRTKSGEPLAAADRDRHAELVTATTFIALSRRYLTAPYEQHHLTIEDTIDTTGRAILGLTLRCARCHDHKFDPVSMEDYYALYGIFASTHYPYAGSEELASMQKPREHFVPLAPPAESAPRVEAYAKMVEQLRGTIATMEKEHPLARQLAELSAKVATGDESVKKERDDAKAQLDAKLKPLRDELRVLARVNLPPDVPGAYAVTDGAPADVPIQLSGDPARPGPIARRGPPKFFAGTQPFAIPDGASGRLELAEWLTRPTNLLTARVMVNRLWQHHFGHGLVATPSNFGLRGEPPSHPELLDWLAATFIERGWSVKTMHRLIVNSTTYQRESDKAVGSRELAVANEEGKQCPEMRVGLLNSTPRSSSLLPTAYSLLPSFPRRRLDAESIRDALLAIGGNLDLTRPGPHPFPPIAAWSWTQHNPFKDVYPSNHRSVYLMTQRLLRHPFLAIFDGPDTNASTDSRGSSTVPLQALYFMNNPLVREQSAGFARRLIAASPDSHRRIELAYELAFGRRPSDSDSKSGRAFVEQVRAELEQLGCAAETRELEAWSSLAHALVTSNEFIYVD